MFLRNQPHNLGVASTDLNLYLNSMAYLVGKTKKNNCCAMALNRLQSVKNGLWH